MGEIWRQIAEQSKELINGLILAINQLISDLLIWGLEVIRDVVAWVLEALGFWVSPFLTYLTILLPDPSGIGFRYVFECYHFFGAWFDFQAFYFVAVLLITLHLYSLAIRVINFCLLWALKLWQAVPFV
jgi:hypothetical protein